MRGNAEMCEGVVNVPLTQTKTSLPQKSEEKEERKRRLISQSISG